ncbi:MAG: NAD(P)H-hydrate dehydratase, partial [Gammaproteobacteria bacterium]|nr:NAD(P)H-hydrate dehydratase [Gammaproteobacteria bacterium]
SSQDDPDASWILTPHPGEASRLLDEDVPAIQDDRFTAIEILQQTYGGTIVLKGAGSLVNAGDGVTAVCPYGNPGMAAAGMGDVLSGVIAALLVQGHAPKEAACLGVLIHARAGDMAAENGQRGLLASDLFVSIRALVNP